MRRRTCSATTPLARNCEAESEHFPGDECAECGSVAMRRGLRLLLLLGCFLSLASPPACAANDSAGSPAIQEEIWALPLTLPTLAYVVHPVGNGPFPLVIM